MLLQGFITLALCHSLQRAKCISLLYNGLRTLCQKQPGCTPIILYPERPLSGANLELGTLFCPDQPGRAVRFFVVSFTLLPCAATHLFISQHLPHSFQKQRGVAS